MNDNFPIDVLEALDNMRPDQQKFFRQMVKAGQSPRLAAMLACRKAPKSKTDDDIARGFSNQYADNPSVGNFFLEQTRKKHPGFNPAGYMHDPRLCANKDPGDIEAWIPRHGAKAHIKRVAEQRGMSYSDGVTTLQARCDDGDDTYRLADDIVEREAKKEVKANRKLSMQEAREKVRAERTPTDIKKGAKTRKGED